MSRFVLQEAVVRDVLTLGLILSAGAVLGSLIVRFDAWVNKGMAERIGPNNNVARGLRIAGEVLPTAAKWMFRGGVIGLVLSWLGLWLVD